MSFIEFDSVYKTYKMGEVTINAADGVTFNIDSPESLLAIKGKCFEKDLPLKRTYNFSNLEKVF
jgi:hypothetical protein